MESSFQRLGRGRRFRKKPADEAVSPPPVDGATATAAATAPRHPGLVAGEGTARARDTASPAKPAPAAAPAANAAHTLRDERPSCAEGTDAFVADDYNAGPPSRPLRGSTRPGLYGQTLVSFGLADADDLFGGGVPLGSVVLVGADARDDSGRRDCGNASTLARYFLAEGVASRHAALWLAPSADRDGKNRRGAALPRRSRAATLPRLAVSDLADDESRETMTSRKTKNDDDDGLRIAWQYRRYLQQGKALDDSRVGARGVGGLAAGVSATGGSAGPGPGSGSGKDSRKNAGGVRRLPAMCHAFDLTREAGGETARTADLRCAPIGGVRNVRNPRSLADAAKSVSFSASFAPNAKSSDDDDGLRAAFAECVRLVERCDASCEAAADEDDAPVGRIVLQFPDFVDDDASAARLARFLRGLRGVLRGGGGGGGGATRATHPKWKRVCAVVTYPMASLSCAAAASLVHAVDAAIELETLPEKTATGEAHAAEALLPDPNLCVALLRVRKMAFPGPGAVAPSPLTRMDRAYALQVRRRRLAVRPLRIAPEDAANGAGHAPDGKTEKTRQSKPLCGGGPADASDALDF